MDSILFLWDADSWRDWGISAAQILGAILAGLLLHRLVFSVLHRVTLKSSLELGKLIVRYGQGPSRLIFPLLFLNLAAPSLRLPQGLRIFLEHLMSLFFIASVSYLLINMVYLLRDMLLSRYNIQAQDNLRARKMYTQIGVLEKVMITVIMIATTSFMLMTFEGIRQIGVSILASAGIAGIIIGLAAQKSIGNILAGLQIAITQPIRVDDVVIVEGEWGWIEDIALTYVVVKIWDLRRLVVPITYFIEKPFQNWTRVSADILGTVFLYVDYSIPVEAVREELQRLVKGNELWDGKVCGLQVTDSKPDVLELRMLVSASSSPQAWDLRCELREKLVEFVQKNYPHCLPKVRAELNGPVRPFQETTLS